MLIVEGPDGAGKTTLIKGLAEMLDIPIAPRVVSKDAEAMVNLQDWVDNNLEEGFQHMIFDRHRLISETIYGPVLRKQQSAGFTDIEWLGPRLERFYTIEPIIIYCLPPLEVVKANILGDDDNKVVADHIEGIYTAYTTRAALDLMYAPGVTMTWDYTRDPQIFKLPIWAVNIANELAERKNRS